MRRIIYDGDSFYELDEECLKKKEEEARRGKTQGKEETRRRKTEKPRRF